MTGPAAWTDPMHGSWEELAVGQALGALEPEDEEAFADHVRGCARCERLIVDVEVGASELAYALAQLTAPDRLRRKVASIAGADSRSAMLPGAARRPLRRVRLTRPTTWARPWLAVAVGLIVVICLSLWNLVLQSDSTAKTNEVNRLHAVVRCVEDPGCQQVRLTSQVGDAPRGVLLIRGDRVTVVLDEVSMNDHSRTAYVLWQQPSDGSATIDLGAFDVTCRSVCVIDVRQALTLSVSSTKQFIISLEARKSLPAQPTHRVAVGIV
jgi:hypothetical protein